MAAQQGNGEAGEASGKDAHEQRRSKQLHSSPSNLFPTHPTDGRRCRWSEPRLDWAR